jgi:ribonuclease HI
MTNQTSNQPQPCGVACTPDSFIAYADGSCLGNPGRGGWAVLIIDPQGVHRAPLSGSERLTTNNRCELLAAIKAYEAIGQDVPGVLFTDSDYVVRGLTEWMPAWQRKGWRIAAGKPVANRDLWEYLQALHEVSQISPRWVNGHAGDPLHEAVDKLARAAAMLGAGR